MIGIENKETVGTDTIVSNYAYTYNALGQRADREQSCDDALTIHKDTFTYDYLGQVTASTNDTLTASNFNPTYAFDEIGNRKSSTGFQPVASYTANAVNQYTAIDGVNPVHDSDGNLTSNGGNWTYAWNGENRLVNADNGTLSIDFIYDYQGRLVEKDDGTNVEAYLYDGWNCIAHQHPKQKKGVKRLN